MSVYFYTQNEMSIRFMKKMLKRLCMGFLALATVVTALPTTPVQAESKQYWTESAERVEALVSTSPEDEDGKTREEVVKTEIEDRLLEQRKDS